MVSGYVYILSCVAMVGIGIFLMYSFTPWQTSDVVIPHVRQGTPNCIRYYPIAERLAESSIDQATMSSYNLQNVGIQCFWGNASNGTRILLGVMLDYRSNNPSIGILTVTEDPQFTKVINATVIPSLRFGSSTG